MVELESSGQMSRSEVAAFLRQFVEELEDDSARVEVAERAASREESAETTEARRTRADTERDEAIDRGDAREITFVVGGDSATVTIPETIDFDVEVQSRSPMLKSSKNQEVDFKLSWKIKKRRGDDSIAMK